MTLMAQPLFLCSLFPSSPWAKRCLRGLGAPEAAGISGGWASSSFDLTDGERGKEFHPSEKVVGAAQRSVGASQRERQRSLSSAVSPFAQGRI